MFDPEKAIRDWRKSLQKYAALSESDIAGLESHLRDEMDRAPPRARTPSPRSGPPSTSRPGQTPWATSSGRASAAQVVPGAPDPHEFLVFLVKVFVAENWLGLTSLGILLSILRDLFRVHGIFDGSNNYPRAQDVYNEVTRRLNDQKSFKYRDIFLLVQNRLIPYITNKIFDCRVGVPQEVWRTENIVMEVNGLSDNVYSFIVCHIGGLLYEYNMETGLTGAKFRNLIVSD